jgi:hypothetical protein
MFFAARLSLCSTAWFAAGRVGDGPPSHAATCLFSPFWSALATPMASPRKYAGGYRDEHQHRCVPTACTPLKSLILSEVVSSSS